MSKTHHRDSAIEPAQLRRNLTEAKLAVILLHEGDALKYVRMNQAKTDARSSRLECHLHRVRGQSQRYLAREKAGFLRQSGGRIRRLPPTTRSRPRSA